MPNKLRHAVLEDRLGLSLVDVVVFAVFAIIGLSLWFAVGYMLGRVLVAAVTLHFNA